MKWYETGSKLALGGLIALFMFEIGSRVIEGTALWRVLPVVEPILGTPDKETGFTYVAGTSGIWVRENRAPVRINSMGLRDEEMTLEKPQGWIRIGLTGDSVTEGLQVPHAHVFDAVAERLFAAKGLNIEIANLAMSGQGPLRQYVRLNQKGGPLNLDYVVSVVSITDFLSTELGNDAMYPAYVDDGNGGLKFGYGFQNRTMVRYSDNWLGQSALWLIRNSHVARILYWRYKQPGMRKAEDAAAAAAATKMSKVRVPGKPDLCKTRSLNELHKLWLGHEPFENWRRTARFFKDYGELVRKNNWRAVYVLIGIPVPGQQPQCNAQRNLRGELVAAIKKNLRSEGIEFFDFSDALMKQQGSAEAVSRLHGFGRDIGKGHLNFKGHEVYGEILSTIIAQKFPAVLRKSKH